MAIERFYLADKVHEATVVLVDDEGHAVSITADQVPDGVHEGTVLRVPIDDQGDPDWSTAQIDQAETNRRRRMSGEILRKLEGGEAELEEEGG